MASCHNKLNKKIAVEEPTTFMSKILDRLFPSKKSASKIYVAYAISVCEYILNLSNQQIQVSESAIKFLISKYLQKVLNKEKLVSLNEDEAATTSITAVAYIFFVKYWTLAELFVKFWERTSKDLLCLFTELILTRIYRNF